MIEKARTLIFFREDLARGIPKDCSIDKIHLFDFNIGHKNMISHQIIMFIDNDGSVMILKNRYGIEGTIKHGKKRRWWDKIFIR